MSSPDRNTAAGPSEPNALPPGTRFGELEILGVLGVGGFGIVYLARDHALQRDVAVKEYMPGQFAQRDGHSQVSLRSAAQRDTFELGLRSFVNEARLLARFDHPSLLKVYRFWEANGTAYMSMPLLHGRNLHDAAREQPHPPPEPWLRRVLLAVLDGLGVLHAQGVLHRDVAPDNIFLPADGGTPILLDFGAARQAIGDRTQTLTAILKPSFAPIEQYAEARGLRQGPWTDLYALAAVMHKLITGHCPAPAPARAMADDYQPLADHPLAAAYSPALLAGLDWALRMQPQQRPADAAALRAVLEGRAEVPQRLPPPAPQQASALEPAPAAGQPLDIEFADTQQVLPEAFDAPEPTRLQPADAPAAAAPGPRSRRPGAGVAWAGLGLALLLIGLFVTLLKAPPSPSAPIGAPSPAPQGDQAVAPLPAASDAGAGAATQPAREPVEFIEPSHRLASGSGALAASAASAALARPGSHASAAAHRPAGGKPELSMPRSAPVIAVPEPVAAPPAQASTPPSASSSASAREPARAEPRSPSEACAGKFFLLKDWCIDRQCERPAFAQHEECVRLRELRTRPGNQP